MGVIEDKISELEEEIRNTQYNKATQHHIGKLKAKIAVLREEAEKRRGGGGSRGGYAIKKAGDATVVLVGFPSVGKSTLLNRLTNANSKVAEYDFTTLNVVPGIMEHRGARFQILDVPGLIKGASRGRGRGSAVISVVKSADLILILVDALGKSQLEVLRKELYEAGIRLNGKRPEIKISKKETGGISVSSTLRLTKIDSHTVEAILREYKMSNADVVIRQDVAMDEFLDAVAGNRIYIPSITVLNKVDLIKKEQLNKMLKDFPGCIPVSAENDLNLDRLRDAIFEKLEFIRVYMKPQGKEADFTEPMIVIKGSTVGDICDRVHGEIRRAFRYAKVTGKSVRFKDQRVGLGHVLEDGDVLTIF